MIDAEHQVRTTLTLDDDVLEAAKVLARQKKRPIGSVISALAREAIHAAQQAKECVQTSERNGFPLRPVRPSGASVDLQLVNSLRDD
jgi:hypothetical protein